MYYELILTHNLQMSLLEELKHKMNESEQNYKQNKQNYEDAYNQINKKTDEVERLVEENNKNNTCMQDVLAKIICAEENYEAAQIEVIEIQNICNAMHKVLIEQDHEREVPIKAMQLAYEKDEIKANKALYTAEKEAELKYKEAKIKLNYIENAINEHPFCRELLKKQLSEAKMPLPYVQHIVDSVSENCRNNKLMYLSKKEQLMNQLPDATRALDNAKNILHSASENCRIHRTSFLREPFESLNEMRNKMNNDRKKSEAFSKYHIINIELQVAKKIVSDALQKYKEEKVNFFKAHLIETLSDAEWKRSNFEMVDNMLKQITVLQNWMNETKICKEKRAKEKRDKEKRDEEKRAKEKRAEEKLAEEKRSEEKRAEEKRAEEKRAEEKLAEEKRAEEKRITRAWTFGFICAVFGVGLTWFRNKDFEYPLIDVTAHVGYLGMQ